VIVLGIDTATSSTAVALRLSDGFTTERRDDPAAGAHPGHATRLLEMAEELLADTGTSWAQVERIAVGAGPGTFTGLRVGIATARGLAQSLDIPLAPVSSLRALAHAALADDTQTASCDGVLAVIDARRGEVFALAHASDGRELSVARPVDPEDIGGVLAEAGSEVNRLLGVGDGAVRYRSQLEGVGVDVPPDSDPLHLLSARTICELGAMDGAERASYQEVLPDYLRRPDAEVKLEESGR
jgi:tRNA threonylcarbamoyladenosine biosynthesis protein TsaB